MKSHKSFSGNIIQPKKKPALRAIELFSGIGGFRIACDNLGINTVWANDLSPESCAVYRARFGEESLVEGDIREITSPVPSHNLLTAGFPCQPFSSAGKKQGTRDARGTLFAEIVKKIEEHLPEYFVLENVKRLISMEDGEHFGTILDAFASLPYFIEWRVLNANNFGLPQNRERIFIIGTRVEMASRAKIKLASLEDISPTIKFEHDRLVEPESWTVIENHGKKFPNWGLAYQGRFFASHLSSFSQRKPMKQFSDLLESKPAEDFYMDHTIAARLQSSVYVNRLVGGVQILYNQAGGARMGYTIFGIDGIAPTLTASHSRHYERYKIGTRYRRLTNKEYARLMGFPDNHCQTSSVFNQYGLYGNAVPPPMAEWAISQTVRPNAGFHLHELSTNGDRQTQFSLA